LTAAQIIDGKAFAAGLRERIRDAVPAFVQQAGRAPGLAVPMSRSKI
jgi:methylenetetrahydrofolate dehydrogenase (NADP+)/methenyltetrahydrofolate cyclohydrolase